MSSEYEPGMEHVLNKLEKRFEAVSDIDTGELKGIRRTVSESQLNEFESRKTEILETEDDRDIIVSHTIREPHTEGDYSGEVVTRMKYVSGGYPWAITLSTGLNETGMGLPPINLNELTEDQWNKLKDEYSEASYPDSSLDVEKVWGSLPIHSNLRGALRIYFQNNPDMERTMVIDMLPMRDGPNEKNPIATSFAKVVLTADTINGQRLV